MMQLNKAQIKDFNVASFFRGYVWDFKKYPDKEIAEYFSKKKNTVIDLTDIKDTQLFYDIRDILICCIVNKEPYSYTSKIFPYLLKLKDFMAYAGYENFACINDVEVANSKWQEFVKCKDYKNKYRKTIENCLLALLEFRDTRTGLNRNIWRLEDLNINKERINKAADKVSMNFWNFHNNTTRELIKSYMKYLLGGTEMAYTTIYGHFSRLHLFFIEFKETSALDITHEDILKFREKHQYNSDTNNHYMHTIESAYKYWKTKNLFIGNIPVLDIDYMPNDRKHKYNSVPEATVLETFKYLHLLKEDYLLVYLINCFTGIRISDICQLKLNCVLKNDVGYFIFHDTQKMQNHDGIPICKELYEMIDNRIQRMKILKTEYLFPSTKNTSMPIRSSAYRSYMKHFVNNYEIKLPDGKPYNFLTHAFRHTIATQLFKVGMPSALIQKGILHHLEINMTRSYIDNTAEIQKEMLISKGVLDTSINADISEADAVLPNGYCHMPANINCPNLNACINCEFFRTTVKFLDIHKEHLEALNKQIEFYKANGYTQNVQFATKEKEKLELIISQLEKINNQ